MNYCYYYYYYCYCYCCISLDTLVDPSIPLYTLQVYPLFRQEVNTAASQTYSQYSEVKHSPDVG